jgi:hypothetical protein
MRAPAFALLLLSACQSTSPEPAQTPGQAQDGDGPDSAEQGASEQGAAEQGAAHAAVTAEPAPAVSNTALTEGIAGTPCGQLDCRRFPDSASALRAVLAHKPQILGVGETHALKGADEVESATSRFERELLPILAGAGATELIVELLGPATGCEKTVQTVKEQQRPVTSEQSQGNQNRFVSLGMKARQLGVVPYILEPTCDEYKSVISSEDGITLMLQLIAQKTEQRLTRYWRRNQGVMVGQTPLVPAPGAAASASPAQASPATTTPPPPPRPNGIVLAYGGAMHNDVVSPPSGENFRYGAHMVQLTQGRYLELDLIVPQYIKDTDVWKALPWYAAYAALGHSDEVTLFRVGPYSYTLVFARGAPAAATAGSAPSERTAPAP